MNEVKTELPENIARRVTIKCFFYHDLLCNLDEVDLILAEELVPQLLIISSEVVCEYAVGDAYEQDASE